MRVLLIFIAFTGLFGLTSYLMNQAPNAHASPKPIAEATSLNTLLKKFTDQENKLLTAKTVRYQQQLKYRVYSLQSKLKETEAAYQELANKYDSLLHSIDSVSQRNTQKAESGNEN